MDLFGIPGDLVGLVLGWLLGLFTPVIAAQFQRVRDRDELVTAIRAELIELRTTMLMLSIDLHTQSKPLDDSFLDVLIESLAKHPSTDPELPKFIESLQRMRSRPVADRPRGSSDAILLQTYSLPLLEANFGRLGICPLRFQQAVINIRRTLDNFNGDVTLLHRHFDKTFDTSLGANYAIVQSNMDRGYLKAGRTVAHIVKQIDQVLTQEV